MIRKLIIIDDIDTNYEIPMSFPYIFNEFTQINTQRKKSNKS